MSPRWQPMLPFASWSATCDTLHAHTQILGKLAVAMAPPEPQLQHEALAVWRAVENRRFLVRVTNTGVTDVIDPAGRVTIRLPVFRPVSTVAEVRRLQIAAPYTRIGDSFAWLVTAAALGVLLTSAESRSRSVRPSLPRPPG